MTISRRQFMIGCSTAIAAMAGSRVGTLVFDEVQAAETANSNEILVFVFLRGGCDGLSLVSPFDDPTYISRRGELALTNPININVNNAAFAPTSSFGFHPQASGLNELYRSGRLALIHACGLDDDTRSHFDAMDYIERGTPGNKTTSSGWITRHLASINRDPSAFLPVMASGSSAPASLLLETSAVTINDTRSYSLNGFWRFSNQSSKLYNEHLKALERTYGGVDFSGVTAGRRTFDTMRALRDTPEYNPKNADGSNIYPNGGFSNSLRSVAQMIKRNLGLRIATVDLGGWDHHENQGVNGGGAFHNLTGTLSNGLAAFYNDLARDGYANRTTIIVMSEFGRRLGRNASDGTDHGHGNVMMVMGGKVNGGRMYGKWPGLRDLDQGQDLRITTDYRTVLSEILVRRLRNPQLGAVFPGLTTYQPLGVTGATSDDLPINFANTLQMTEETPESLPTE